MLECPNTFPNFSKSTKIISLSSDATIRQTDVATDQKQQTHFISYNLHMERHWDRQTGRQMQTSPTGTTIPQRENVYLGITPASGSASRWHQVVPVPPWERTRLVTPMGFITQLLPIGYASLHKDPLVLPVLWYSLMETQTSKNCHQPT